jgi:hypothetical protein
LVGGTYRRLEVRGPGIADAVIVSAIVVFLAGVVAGIGLIVSIGIRREGRDPGSQQKVSTATRNDRPNRV